MKNNVFDSLQNWYYLQCDGDWEHEFGIKIDTLDNPGWSVVIDLKNTLLENKSFNEIDQCINEDSWIQCEVKDQKFNGAGGPKNLNDIIGIFVAWAKKSEESLD